MWEERGPWIQRARQSCPAATSTVPSGTGHQPVLCRPWPPKTGCEEGQVRLGGKMSLNKLAGSVVSRGYTGGSGQPVWLICPSAISPAWTKLWPCGVKGKTEAQRWQILVLGPTEFRAAQAQDKKATPGFGVESDLCPCPRYSQASTAHGKNANAQNGIPTLIEALEILHNPSTSLRLCVH